MLCVVNSYAERLSLNSSDQWNNVERNVYFCTIMPTHRVQRPALSLGRTAAPECAYDDDDDAECNDYECSLAPVHSR